MKCAQTVSATQLVRDLAAIRTMTVQGPVGITSHGRTELIVLNAQRFAELNSGNDLASIGRLEAKLSIVLDSIDTHVAIVDHNLNVRRINLAMRRSLRLSDEPLTGQPVVDLLPPELAPFLAKRMREVHHSGRVAEFDFASVLSPGRTIHARMMPWPGGIAYFSDDITDRLAGIERDMENAAFREASLALGSRGCGVISADGTVRKADSGLTALSGIPVDRLEGRAFLALFDPVSRSRVEAAVDWRTSKHSVLDVAYPNGEGRIADGRLSLAPFFSSDGRPCYAFVLAARGPD